MRNFNVFGCFCGQSSAFIPENQVIEFVKQAQNGNVNALNAIIVSNQARIVRIIKNLNFKISDSLFYEDLFNEGALALANAVKNFSLANGSKFYPYANVCIRGAVLDFLNNSMSTIRVPKAVSQQLYNIKKIASGTPVTSLNASKIAKKLNISSAKVLKLASYNYTNVSLYRNSSSSGKEFCVADAAEICSSTGVDSEFFKNEFSKNFWASFDALSEREQLIITKHLALFGGDPLSFSKIGELIGVSKARAQQIFVSACKKLRNSLNAPCFNGYIAA